MLLLERGDYLPREIENWDPRSIWLDGRYNNSGQWTDLDTGKQFTPKQHYYVGGNTKFYGAILFPMRERDFGAVTHVDGVSPAWPLDYRDFEPYYTRAEQLYQVHGVRGVDPDDPPSATGYPYPPISDEPRIAQLNADIAGAGMHPFPLPNGILIDEARPQLSACVRCATCDGYPCITNGKADSQVICVDPALRYPNVTMRTRALVTGLKTDASGGRIERVVVERDGEREEYSADVVVLAAGAINSAALLLRSASERHPQGLGNGSGVVGRNLMMHNNSSLIAFSTMPNPTRFQKTVGVNDFYFGDPAGELGYPLGAIQMLGKSDAVLIGFDAPEADDPVELARHAMDFWLTTEDLPPAENRVSVDADGAISLRYQPTNLAAHQKLRGALRRAARRDAVPGGRAGELQLPRRPAGHRRGGVPERHGPLRRRPGVLGAGPQLPDARGGQPLPGRLVVLRVQLRGEPDVDDHRQRTAGGRPHRRAAGRPHPGRAIPAGAR